MPQDKRDDLTDAPQRAEPVSGLPLRVWIMEKGRELAELWLPSTPEGCYAFGANSEGVEYPVSIAAGHGCWTAECTGEAEFLGCAQKGLKHLPITNGMRASVQAGQRLYTIYAETERPGDNIFLPYRLDPGRPIRIGRLPESEICCGSILVSRQHGVLQWNGLCWVIRDLGSTNGIYVNGRQIVESVLNVGDTVFLVGLRLILGVDYLAINSGNGRAVVNESVLRPIDGPGAIRYAAPRPRPGGNLFQRYPRRRELLAPPAIRIEGPPPSLSSQIPLLLRMGNPLMMGGRAMLTGNVLGTVTSMLIPLATQGFTEKDRHAYEKKRREKYGEYLEEKRSEIRAEIAAERAALTEMYPASQDLLAFAFDGSERLWERKSRDDDFLSVRIGAGRLPLQAQVDFPMDRFQLEEDELEDEMDRLAQEPRELEDAPILLPLRKDFVCGVCGEAGGRRQLLRSLMLQLVLTHSYDEVKLVLLLEENADPELLQYARYLRHFWDNERTIRYIACTPEDAQQLSRVLTAKFEEYQAAGGKIGSLLKSNPCYVILAQSRELFERMEFVQDICAQESFFGFSVVTFFDSPPKESRCLVQMGGDEHRLIHIADPAQPDLTFRTDPCEKYAGALRELMRVRLDLGGEQYRLPSMISFLELYGAETVEHLNPLKRWVENNPVKSLAAPIGIGTDGKPFTLDLHEKRQGPHGLIAGGTGSGKSEFIITYVLSMAVNYSPDEVAFVLIDYKGGGLADAFVDKKRGLHLPHVVGTITNLDGAGISRSLVSINSELKRRQRLFSRAKSETGEGTMDIYDYQRLYRQGRVKEPLPHLFIVSDEFAELKKQQPEFMDELISTARIGRSLGVHLILATQKPAGVVSDQIWSNTRFRVCLKVADRGDSYEMLKRYEAAEIKNTGRFYLQVGYNELFAMGQSAWCGAPYEPGEKAAAAPEYSIRFLDCTGQAVMETRTAKARSRSTRRQVVAIVQYLSDLAAREGIRPRMLWKEPLPKALSFRELTAQYPMPKTSRISALIGLADDPERQKQYPYVMDLQSFHNMSLIAPGGTGKSTFLRTMLYSLTMRYSPEELTYYIADLSGGALGMFCKMPHCGAYIKEDGESDFHRLMELLREMAARRKKLFEAAEVTSYDAYLQVGRMPLVLFLIDGYHNVPSQFARGSEIYANLHTFMAEVSAYGIHVVLTVNHNNEISTRSKQEIDYRVALCPKDRYDAAEMLSAKTKNVPPQLPGRGLCVIDSRVLEFHAASFCADGSEQAAVQQLRAELEAHVKEAAYPCGAEKLPSLCSGVTYAEFCAGTEPDRIPLGYSIKDMRPVRLPFRQWVTLPVYLGNPAGIRPVIGNLLYAAERNGMEVVAVRRNENSVFSGRDSLLEGRNVSSTLRFCTQDDLQALAERLNGEVLQRNEFVTRFCAENDIPQAERGKAKKAAGYVRAHTTPLLILFESFRDFALQQKSDWAASVFRAFLGTLKGYNIYFAGCFYPEDLAQMRSDALCQAFCASETQLLLGGRYHLQGLSNALPTEFRRREQPENYDCGLLHYQDGWYELQMPCGELVVPEVAPDDAPII